MICLTRLNGEPFALNPDLIERVEAHPDTVISLTDGNVRFLVRESLPEVLAAIRDCRADVLATAYAMDRGTHPRPLVSVVTADDADVDPTEDGDHAVLPFPHREER
ncbi:flagellar FlbD family protein [Klenkia sp. LSe6-5]|uniref:Flagellar FlbD family protein n=1 Tax=Klenkia sesuvii TaxID=3103137 RepID=A0ABU8DPF6_9ACTN